MPKRRKNVFVKIKEALPVDPHHEHHSETQRDRETPPLEQSAGQGEGETQPPYSSWKGRVTEKRTPSQILRQVTFFVFGGDTKSHLGIVREALQI